MPDGGGAGGSAGDAPPPDAVAKELAKLADAGDAKAAGAMKEIDALSKRHEEREAAAKT